MNYDKTITTPDPKKAPVTTEAGVPMQEQPVTGGNQFPDTDTWNGKKVDSNYATVPSDKEAILENLKKAGQEVQTRFGLETRGLEGTPLPENKK